MGGVSHFTQAEREKLAIFDAKVDKQKKRGRPFQDIVSNKALQMRRYRAKRKTASRLQSESGTSKNILTT